MVVVEEEEEKVVVVVVVCVAVVGRDITEGGFDRDFRLGW